MKVVHSLLPFCFKHDLFALLSCNIISGVIPLLVISNPLIGYLLQFYIDPKSGYIFRSKKDVFRYLETGEISRHAFKPKDGGDDDQELINDKKSVS